MAYVTKVFSDKEVLTHNHMNNIIAGIDELKSGSVTKNNLKTINGVSLIGSGDITISSGDGNISASNNTLYEEAKKLISRFNHQYMNNINYDASKVDIIMFAGQSNSCGRATLASATTPKDLFLTVSKDIGFTFQNSANGSCDSTIKEIKEPLTINGSSAYGYIPAFINAYYSTTGRKVCACFKSNGGTSIHNWFPYELDANGNETNKVPTYYTNMLAAINSSKTHLQTHGYELGDVLMVWCQGENDAAYLGNDIANSYCTEYETTLKTDEQKIAYYKKGLSRIAEKLKEDVGLTTIFNMRIGHSGSKKMRNQVIIEAQNQLCSENPDCVMISTIMAGAKDFIEEDGSKRDLMIDASHYLPEGYLRAGMEGGINAGIYQKSNKMIKPILLEYNTLYLEGTGQSPQYVEHERPVDKFIYDPCRIDFNFMRKFTESVATTAISLSAPSTTVEMGKTLKLSCAFTPTNASDTALNYSSSNTSRATVSAAGIVTGIAIGEVSITAKLASDESIVSTITINVVESSGDDNPSSGGGNTGKSINVVDFDFTINTLNDYSLDGSFTIPDTSTPEGIEYDNNLGMSLNNNLPYGLTLTNPVNASKPWTLEFTGIFATPTVLAGNRRALITGVDDLTPFVVINSNNATRPNLGFQISSGSHSWVGSGEIDYDQEVTYKIVHDGNNTTTVYENGLELGDSKVNWSGKTFGTILGVIKGKSTAYTWQNVETGKKSYLKKFKFSYTE